MTEDIQRFVDSTLTQNLANIRRIQNPKDILIKVIPSASLKEGEFAIVKDGFTAPWEAAERIFLELHDLNIRLEPNIQRAYRGDVKFVPFQREGADLCKFVAPWYVELYCDKAQADPKVKQILRDLNHVSKQNDRRFIFRGEQCIYPTVRSTLARHWNTNSADALRVIGDKTFTKALGYLRDQPRHFETTATRERAKLDVLARIQHMGGVTNSVDFSAEAWVALFFACIDVTTYEPRSRQFVNTGRIWMLDQNKDYDDIEIFQLDRLADRDPDGRWDRQSGVVVIPNTGTIPVGYLEEVVRINPGYKSQLNEFLQKVGITIPTMYNDLEGYIRYEQDFISLEALCYMMMEQLGAGDYSRALGISGSLININDNPIANEIGYYFRGLCHAVNGALSRACSDIDRFCEMRSDVPEYVLDNRKNIRNALKSNGNRDYGRKRHRQLKNLKKIITLEIDKRLWSVSFSGYTYRAL